MKYHVYILENNSGRHYIGISSNTDKRLLAHNKGKVRSTKPYKPWRIVYIEDWDDRILARKREIILKNNFTERTKILEKL